MAPILHGEPRTGYSGHAAPWIDGPLRRELIALHRRGSAIGWPPDCYLEWAAILRNRRPQTPLIGPLTRWGRGGL